VTHNNNSITDDHFESPKLVLPLGSKASSDLNAQLVTSPSDTLLGNTSLLKTVPKAPDNTVLAGAM